MVKKYKIFVEKQFIDLKLLILKTPRLQIAGFALCSRLEFTLPPVLFASFKQIGQ